MKYVYNKLIPLFIILEKLDNVPTIILGIGTALLAVLIPLAIAILQDIYQKRKEEKFDFTDLDRHVILDRVFRIRLLLLYIALIYIPMIFWNVSPGVLRLLELAMSLYGILLMGVSFLNIYSWVKGNVLKFRFSYLKSVKNHSDLETVWRSVWQTKNINPQNEREFFKMFANTIDRFLK